MEKLAVQTIINVLWTRPWMTYEEVSAIVAKIEDKLQRMRASELENGVEVNEQVPAARAAARAPRRGSAKRFHFCSFLPLPSELSSLCQRERQAVPRVNPQQLSAVQLRETVSKLINEANMKLSQFGFRIQIHESGDDGSAHVCLTNVSSDTIARKSSKFDSAQIYYFKKLIDLIIRSPNGVISIEEARNARDAAHEMEVAASQALQHNDKEPSQSVTKKLNLELAEATLHELGKDLWLNVDWDHGTFPSRSNF